MIDEIRKNAQDKITTARHIEAMINSQGWEIFENILDRKIEDLADLSKITTIKELEGAKRAVKILKSLKTELLDLVNQAPEAEDIISKLP